MESRPATSASFSEARGWRGRFLTRATMYMASINRKPSTRPGITRSEEHTSELQSLMRISYAVFCLKKKTHHKHIQGKGDEKQHTELKNINRTQQHHI